MKIQCDVCENAPATVICCADEAALCSKCDVEVHAANKLASKHQRLHLDALSNKLPKCDICQDKTAFIFCVEDRALFCKDCDEPIHSAGSISSNHQRFLATGIRVALASSCAKETEKQIPEPPSNQKLQPACATKHTVQSLQTVPQQPSNYANSPTWAVDDLLQFSDFESSDKLQKDSSIDFGELDWFTDIGMYNNQVNQEASMAAAEVPQLSISSMQPSNNTAATYKSIMKSNYYMPANKKPRIEISDDEENFMVPDLG
ncbi:B-box zinc finger protein 24-like isoform X1 [Papaver somniferum]|uniref:B-box zinc finger protein 24-like isoform X1 n=1 Tax=Papaver somniferum TaxID=3469 RepID=UPI000E6F8FF1|nr:B-box zinc finger protein 24-like isoform X1 [Papaver somniferum]